MRGGSPLSNQDVNIALLSSAIDRPIISTPKRGTGPLNTIGNIPKDVQDVARGFLPGLAKFVWRFPSEVKHSYLSPESHTEEGMRAMGYEDTANGGLGAVLRNAQRDPFGSLIPGNYTLANLTTSEGRKELQRHPIMTLLDILPAASKAGELATRGLEEGAEGTARQAFQQGKPIRGTFRAATDTAAKIPVVGKVASRERWNKFAADLGINEAVREKLSRPHSVMTRRADKEQALFMREKVMPLFEGMDEASRAELAQYAERRRTGTIQTTDYNPEYEAILKQVDDLNNDVYLHGEAEGALKKIGVPGTGRSVIYSSESPVVHAHLQRVRAQEALARIDHRLGNARDVLANWNDNLAKRIGKVKGFMEDPAVFAARGEGAVGPDVIREASRPMVEAFQHLDPEAVFREYLDKIHDGSVRRATGTFLMRDFAKLKGEAGIGPNNLKQGLVASMDEALGRGDVRAASKYATEISRILRHKSWDGFDTTTRIREHMKDIRGELVGLRKRTTSYNYAGRMVRKAEDRVSRYESLYDAARSKYDTRTKDFLTTMQHNPATSFHPLIVDAIRRNAMNEARVLYNGAELDDVLERIRQAPTMDEMKSLVGAKTFDAILTDVRDNWMDFVRDGYDPVWIHHVPPSRYENSLKPRVLPDIESRPSLWRDTVLNFGPGVMDVSVGLGAASAEIISRKYTSRYLEEFVKPVAKEKAVVREEIVNRLRAAGATPREIFGETGELERILKREYRDFDPNVYGMKWPSITREGFVLPVGVDRALNHFTRGFQFIPLRGAYDKAMKVYKFSVLAGFKQFSDTLFGGLLTTVMYEPRALFKMRDSYAMIMSGQVPEELAHNFYELSTDQLHAIAAGKTMGRMVRDATIGSVEKLAHFEEGVTTMYRAATYLAASERALAKGLDPAIAREVGLRTAYKALVDFDGMSWLERTAIRQAFPFYSFMRYLMRFMLSYPSDHPLRAAVLSRFADIENRDQKDMNGQMAEKWQNYFFLGKPDENGNVFAVDYRAANPFNSAASHFTLAGFLSGLNPALTAPFEAAGVNALTATPELYPDMAYDTETGTLQARRQGNAAVNIAEQLLPPIQGVDAFLGVSDRMRRLKETNPEAYRRTLYQHLHLPFAAISVNVPNQELKAQMGRVEGARQEVTNALRTGDFERVKRYNLVPYQGQLVDPAKLERFWHALTAALQQQGLNVNPKAILPR